MEIILQEDVESLGQAGEVVKVKDGFARNFLLPQKKAVLANAANMKSLDRIKKIAADKSAKLKVEAEVLAKQMQSVAITLLAEVGEEGKLFGSITTSDITHALREQDVRIERQQIQMKDPIKKIGEYDIPVKLHPEVVVNIKVTVTARPNS